MTTWDPNNKSANETLSGGNLIATSTGLGTVAATRVATAAKSYFEVNVTTATGVIAVGLVNRSYNMASGTILGTDVNGVGYKSGGTVVINNATVSTIATYTTAAKIGVAVDLARMLIWFTLNGTTWNNDVIANQNPVGDVGGISLATMALGSALPAAGGSLTGAILAGVFATASFTYTPPPGYSSVDTCGATATNSNTGKSSAYSTTGGGTNEAVTTVIAARASWLGPGNSGKPSGGGFSPAQAITTVSGQVQENAVPVTGKTVRAYDNHGGQFLGYAVSDGSGNWSIPALGRTLVDVIAADTGFNDLIFATVVPG